MTADALALALALAVIVLASTFLRIRLCLAREHARERQLLVNQVMHLSGQTWQPPPAPERAEPVEQPVEYVHPSQLPA